MNPEVKAQWITALRTGGIKQAHMTLRSGDAMCCLGVLCHISNKGVWKAPTNASVEEMDWTYVVGLNKADKILDRPVQDWSGMPDAWGSLFLTDADSSGLFDRDDHLVTLAGANDNGCTFDQIADLIQYFF